MRANLDRLLRNARDDRAFLRERWTEGATLTGREQLKLAKGLLAIKPATVERHGHRVPCESRFELRPKDRRRLVEAMLADNLPEGEIIAAVPGLSRRTFRHIRDGWQTAKSHPANGSVERRIRQKRDDPVGPAYLDSADGGDAEAEARFWELVGGMR